MSCPRTPAGGDHPKESPGEGERFSGRIGHSFRGLQVARLNPFHALSAIPAPQVTESSGTWVLAKRTPSTVARGSCWQGTAGLKPVCATRPAGERVDGRPGDGGRDQSRPCPLRAHRDEAGRRADRALWSAERARLRRKSSGVCGDTARDYPAHQTGPRGVSLLICQARTNNAPALWSTAMPVVGLQRCPLVGLPVIRRR